MDDTKKANVQPFNMITRKITVSGHVQGVGFRPFIYRLAKSFGLTGSVTNQTGKVSIICQGDKESIDQFIDQIISKAPPLSIPAIASAETIESPAIDLFSIASSKGSETSDIHIPPDYFTCDECLDEISDVSQRRYQYPFTNCTQCGPRYTIIESLPYDRLNTGMKEFPLCEDCQKEYSNPQDRRFHAQPLACEKCGPVLTFKTASIEITDNSNALAACLNALREGQIIAVKGIGGYHLLCDAGNEMAVQTLRQRKHRPDKPLAVMFPMTGDNGLENLTPHVSLTDLEAEKILSPQRPIILVKKNPNTNLAPSIAPDLNEIGVFLPYSPLHYLLLQKFQKPLVATSGNISGEPVITDPEQAQQKINPVADGFLHHNRPILRPADDSVIRVIAGKARNMRLGRGIAPLELTLPKKIKQPTLAVGGHLKVTIALAWQDRLVISPHISDLDTARGMEIFEQVIEDLQQLYQLTISQIICDAHPGYQSHRWANRTNLPVHKIWHHHAHAAVVCGEYPDIKNWLMFCWDGVGLGNDNSLWGGETFHGSAGHWAHLAGFKPFHLPGADQAGREPWRSTAALRWQTGDFFLPEIENASLALQAWQKKINCPQSSAAGRLFDAAANMILHIDKVSHEGQGPMQLEAIADRNTQAHIDMPLIDDKKLKRIDWSLLLKPLQDQSISASERAAIFHNSMAKSIIDQALLFKKQYAFEAIGLSGGVFQNRYLVEKIKTLAAQEGLKVYLPATIPVNDGGLSYGQIIEFLGT